MNETSAEVGSELCKICVYNYPLKRGEKSYAAPMNICAGKHGVRVSKPREYFVMEVNDFRL